MLGQQLDRDVALEPLVEREVDRRHPSDPEAALDPVAKGDCLRVVHCEFALPPVPEPPLELPVPPPTPAPPVPVEVVPGVVGVVAGVVFVLVGVVGVVLVLVGVVGVVAVWVCVVVVSVGVVSVCVVGVGCTLAHWRRASWAIVETPWVRLFRSVELIDDGRLTTSSASRLVALETSPQFLLASAEDTESSRLLSEEA